MLQVTEREKQVQRHGNLALPTHETKTLDSPFQDLQTNCTSLSMMAKAAG